MEAFSDGVLAIIITIMVLELKVPHGADLTALQPLLPILLSYLLSFIYIGIDWNKQQSANNLPNLPFVDFGNSLPNKLAIIFRHQFPQWGREAFQ
jgi:Endosomal/lysosomal potassium channel TMEM175